LPWSHHQEKKEERGRRKEKNSRRKVWLKTQKDVEPGRVETSLQGSKRERTSHSEDEWEELAREERMAKKLRKGDVSQEMFEKEFLSL